MAAIETSACRRMVVNCTISPQNAGYLDSFCALVAALQNVAGVFFYFVTPMAGNDDLVMPLEQRAAIVERLLRLKRAGAPVLNSAAALRRVARDEWKRFSSLCCLYADGRLYRCCRSIGDPKACAGCGYLGYAELEAISRLQPGALIENLRLVLQGRRRARGRTR